MTYNEWRDELKSNLLCVSENERRRVLDYYAEAYADRREAGFTEREIIEDFGAPYDAAQRILAENRGGYGDEYSSGTGSDRTKFENRRRKQERDNDDADDFDYIPSAPQPAAKTKKKNDDHLWIFILLCVIFCVPLFGLLMSVVGITIGFCVAPVVVIGSGALTMIGGIVAMIFGSVGTGLCTLGIGVIVIGAGIVLCPLFFKFVRFLWQWYTRFFAWLKSLFCEKEGE